MFIINLFFQIASTCKYRITSCNTLGVYETNCKQNLNDMFSISKSFYNIYYAIIYHSDNAEN